MILRECKCCGESKPTSEFYAYQKKGRASACVTGRCKACFNAAAKKRRDENPEVKDAQAAREKSRRESDPEFRQRKIAVARDWYSNNKEYAAERNRVYKSQPHVVDSERLRKSAWNKSEAGRAYFAKRQRDRRATEEGKITDAVRRLLYRCLDASSSAKIASTYEALGYNKELFRSRIEMQFAVGMSWLNHGDWHIDHKKPVSAFIAQGITSPRTINALCNLQPLWAPENLSKSAKWESLPRPANDNGPVAVAA